MIYMDTKDKFEIDMHAYPLWNNKYPLWVYDNKETTFSFPVSDNNILGFKHCRPLSQYISNKKYSSLNTWHLLSYFDGKNTISDICTKIISQFSEVSKEIVIQKISTLLKSNYIILVKYQLDGGRL